MLDANSPKKILLIEDDQNLSVSLGSRIEAEFDGLVVHSARNHQDADDKRATESYDLFISDIDTRKAGGSENAGIEWVKQFKAEHPDVPVILYSDKDSFGDDMKRESIRRETGADYAVNKKELDIVISAISDALDIKKSARKTGAYIT